MAVGRNCLHPFGKTHPHSSTPPVSIVVSVDVGLNPIGREHHCQQNSKWLPCSVTPLLAKPKRHFSSCSKSSPLLLRRQHPPTNQGSTPTHTANPTHPCSSSGEDF